MVILRGKKNDPFYCKLNWPLWVSVCKKSFLPKRTSDMQIIVILSWIFCRYFLGNEWSNYVTSRQTTDNLFPRIKFTFQVEIRILENSYLWLFTWKYLEDFVDINRCFLLTLFCSEKCPPSQALEIYSPISSIWSVFDVTMSSGSERITLSVKQSNMFKTNSVPKKSWIWFKFQRAYSLFTG